jgi:hypothetical protein
MQKQQQQQQLDLIALNNAFLDCNGFRMFAGALFAIIAIVAASHTACSGFSPKFTLCWMASSVCGIGMFVICDLLIKEGQQEKFPVSQETLKKFGKISNNFFAILIGCNCAIVSIALTFF